jgi:hypothetical protein
MSHVDGAAYPGSEGVHDLAHPSERSTRAI